MRRAGAILQGQKILDGLTEEDSAPRKPGWILAALVLLALALRFVLYRYHQMIEGDGVHYAALARLISRDGSLLGAANNYWSNLWPLVIAAFDLFVQDIELAGRLASTLFGSLTVLPVYLICREFLNTRTSLVASSLVAAQPYLLRFSVLLYTESFYTFLLAWVLWLGIRLIKSPDRTEGWLWLGLLVGAGLWTRPEIQAPAFLLIIVSLVRSFLKRMALRKVSKGTLLFAGVVLVFLFSRAVLIHHYLGKWDFGFGEKVTFNIREGLLYYGDHEKYLNEFENGRFVNLGPEKRSLFPFLWENRVRLVSRLKGNLTRILPSYAEVLAPTKGIPVLRKAGLGLMLLGILGTLLQKKTRHWALLLIIIAVLYSIPWLFIFIVDRFIVPLAIISVIFTAAGLLILESGIAALFRRRRLTAWPVLSLLIVISFSMRTATWARRDRNFIWENDLVVQKEAGLFLKDHFPQKTRILTWGPHIPFYFYDGNSYNHCIQNIPYAPYEEVMDYVRRKKIALLVLPEWILIASDFPIKGLVVEGVQADGLDFVKVIGRQKPERIWIYKVLRVRKTVPPGADLKSWQY
jgi:hypothetical protein